MITCKLYIFPKRRNSTKEPTQYTPYELDGELKTSFSPLSMAITFNFGPTVIPPPYNYARIDALERYYFIENWTYSGGLWIGYFTVDVLASHKTAIGNSLQFVSRAFSSYDSSIIDTTYLSKADGITRLSSSITPTAFWGADPSGSNGLIVVGVVGSSASGMGPTTFYAMSISTFNAFITQLLSSISWAGISTTEISAELQKALINPMQYIVSAKWFPIDSTSFSQGVATSQIKLGYWSFNLSGSARVFTDVNSSFVTKQQEFPIPKAPQSIGDPGARLQYLNLSPFADYSFKFLPFGQFTLDSTDLFDMSYLGIRVSANLISGDAVLALSAKDVLGSYDFDNRPILCVTGQIGVDIPVAQISIDATKIKSGLASAGASVAADISRLLGG